MKIKVKDYSMYEDVLKEPQFANSVKVEVRSTVLAVREIDTIGQKFDADVFVDLVWRHPQFKNKTLEELGNLNQYGIFTFNNLLEMKSEEKWNVKVDADTVATRMRVKATFEEGFELQDFPFDIQELSVVLVCVLDMKQTHYIRSERPSIINSENFTSADWSLSPSVSVKEQASDPSMSASGVRYSRFYITSHIQRQHEYYFWNVFLLLFALCSLCWTTFSIDASEVSDRMSVVLTVILTAVAFKFVVAGNIPKVPYNTFVDSYILACFGFLSIIAAENAIVGAAYSHVPSKFDPWFAFTLGVLWFAFNIIQTFRGLRKIKQNTEYLKKMKN